MKHRQIVIELKFLPPDQIKSIAMWNWGDRKTISINPDDKSIELLCKNPKLLLVVLSGIAGVLNGLREQLLDATAN